MLYAGTVWIIISAILQCECRRGWIKVGKTSEWQPNPVNNSISNNTRSSTTSSLFLLYFPFSLARSVTMMSWSIVFANQGKRVKQTSKSLRQVGALKNSKIFGWPNYDDQVFIRFPYPISLCVRNNINTDAIFIMRTCFKNQDASEFWLIQSEIQTKLNTNCLLLTLERSQRRIWLNPRT